MVIIEDNKIAHINVSKKQAGILLGVNRTTILRWERTRIKDGTFREVFLKFIIYFSVRTHKLNRGANLKKP